MLNLNRPLVEKLMEFKKNGPVSFHVPGHKHGSLSELPRELKNALSFDVTELTGLDDLHQPTSVIKESQQLLTNLYQTDASYFLVNGSTVGNLAMVYATCKAGDTVIVQRNAHKSIFNALELVGVKPILITPEWDQETLSVGTVKVEQVNRALESYPEARAVILTYPTYYGVTGDDLKDIINVAHNRSVPVLVDEAHGAHFIIGSPFPQSALDLGADVVVHSAHKTLPAMTMASFLHIKSSLVSSDRIEKYLQMLQSSSPSYVLMASLDDARAYVETYTKNDIESLLERRKKLIDRLQGIPALVIREAEDPLKLMLSIEGYTGFQVLKALEKENIYVELADAYQAVLVLPLLKKEHSYDINMICRKIDQAIQLVKKEKEMNAPVILPSLVNEMAELCYNREELEQFEAGWVDYEDAIGKVAADSVIPYPPGIPLVLAGERIEKETIRLLKTLTDMKASFQGTICPTEQKILVVLNE